MVFGDNARAIALHEKRGFRREGIRRCHAFRQGRYADTDVMALLLAD
jgi:RimJ/RimL family protein N-acetyltransferase